MTTTIKTSEARERWLLYDASQHNLGRLAAEIALNLLGKDLPTYTPSQKTGAFVVVVNAEKIKVTGNKAEQKQYFHYSGYPGGRKEVDFADLLARRPTQVVSLAVKRMLPKTILGRDLYRRLKVYVGPDHPHAAQQPVKVETLRT